LISLANESSGGEVTSAITRLASSSGLRGFTDRFHRIPALRSAVAQAALSTAFGSVAVVVSRRGTARMPMDPVMTQPPPLLGRSLSRERLPVWVVAVMETSELIPSGAVSISRALCPSFWPGRTVNQTIFS
jgi:hypothetical protein